MHENRGYLMIRGLWERGQESTIYVQATNVDSPSHVGRSPAKTLQMLEKRKKGKYEKDWLDVRRTFSPFITSVDGLQGIIAKNVICQLAHHLSKKWQRPYSVVCGYIRARVSVATVRATNRCIRGSRIPARLMSANRPQWEDGLGLSLFR